VHQWQNLEFVILKDVFMTVGYIETFRFLRKANLWKGSEMGRSKKRFSTAGFFEEWNASIR